MVLHRRLAEEDMSHAPTRDVDDLVVDRPPTGAAWSPPAGLEGLT